MLSKKKLLEEDESGSKLTESLVDSMVRLYPDYLGRLDDTAFGQGVRVLVRRDYDVSVKRAGKVAIISGGGSGHEPAHAGFLGRGLLTAAVCGDIFASPTAKAVLCAIATVSNASVGCLLIVKNYTGDRLNFGIAAETARSRLGIPVETVYVSDDAALPNATQPRGLAGTIIVHKIAGAVAERGADLAEVAAAARIAANRLATTGICLRECLLPGSNATISRLADDEVELGLGIHNEPGSQRLQPMPSVSILAQRLVDACLNKLLPPKNDTDSEEETRMTVALVSNNLGGTSGLEMTIFGASCIKACEKRSIHVVRCLDGALITSLEAHGASITLFRLDDDADLAGLDGDLLDLLDAPCVTPAGSLAFRRMDLNRIIVPAPKAALLDDDAHARPFSAFLAKDAPTLKTAITVACQALINNEAYLTELDTAVGDGDCGTTLASGARSILALMQQEPKYFDAGAPTALAKMAHIVANTMGGTSGALYTLGLRAAEASLRAAENSDNDDAHYHFRHAFVTASRAVSDCGGAAIGSKTMCDAIIPAADVLRRPDGTLKAAALAARKGADSTVSIIATHGRSANVAADKQQGVADPGAIACALMLEAAANAF
uniref:Dihydroxyacetone kinase n=1 Tax=Aureoumbra lagunensis TaxID=44058 RepID=A0A7S3JST3_9STRA|mmetsp:Transcript_17164/g.22294  ORF Transcript_17164/g.22294 Transcript_17164/m.22294 type:complete len:607 (+) Transcript_17164:104-1924(+)|eukprot:CAMPEP_0197293238 /NCGR_PEP_ID=MMETSP0890-20130614/27441_1 /TAXON_ID=44058 ORGANISM="Aureoumbra lagunensis, Strain CCMP1510" /NCGR_SAMPLE_ID=MMETSP0890 /ASSEMBLY_ACC=CAM_ASM_000533 /LENGTH=606 /DNA_ID=CAMNT_0042767797 /DNA_START=77 /DNA_END=1897 /DNA_ORIENTATION=-